MLRFEKYPVLSFAARAFTRRYKPCVLRCRRYAFVKGVANKTLTVLQVRVTTYNKHRSHAAAANGGAVTGYEAANRRQLRLEVTCSDTFRYVSEMLRVR